MTQNSPLTFKTYVRLRRSSGDELKDQTWFKASYPVFLQAGIPTSKADLVRLIAFAYSWMPTIPNISKSELDQFRTLSKSFTKLKRANELELASLLRTLIPLVNNSLVGASKVLHFVEPKHMPVIDRRVIQAWNLEFGNIPGMKLKGPLYGKSNINRLIQTYVTYRNHMIDWKRNCKNRVSLRELELSLYSQVI